MSSDSIDPDDVPTVQVIAVQSAMVPRQGVTILFHYYSDGTVTASSQGLVGTGRTAAEALVDLEHQLRIAHPRS
jgi:hypothetical protein